MIELERVDRKILGLRFSVGEDFLTAVHRRVARANMFRVESPNDRFYLGETDSRLREQDRARLHHQTLPTVLSSSKSSKVLRLALGLF